MDTYHKALLARFEPEGLGSEGPGWQQRKSAQTRIGIPEAAIDCLAKYGYSPERTARMRAFLRQMIGLIFNGKLNFRVVQANPSNSVEGAEGK